jgi:hypothetical protein
VLENLKFGSRIHNIQNDYPLTEKRAIGHETPVTFYNSILQALDENKKICCVWASKTKMLKFNDKLKERGYKSLVYYDKTDDCMKRELCEVNKIWSNPTYQIIMYSPTITVGVDFNLPNVFDKIYVWGSAMSCPVRDTIQGTMRVRKPKENVMEYYLYTNYNNADRKYKYLSYDEILKLYLDHEQNIKDYIKRYSLENLDDPYLPSWYLSTYIFNKREDHASNRDYRRVFIEYLKKCGYTKFETFSSQKTDIEPSDTSSSYLPYDEIPNIINHDEYERIQYRIQNKLASTTDKWKNEKYHFDKRIINEVSVAEILKQRNLISTETDIDIVEGTLDAIRDNIWKIWNTSKDDKQLITNISTEKNKTVSVVLKQKNDARQLNDVHALQYACVRELCDIIDIENSFEPFIIPFDTFQKFKPDILNLETKISNAFKKKTSIKISSVPTIKEETKRAVKIIHIALSGWNGSSVSTNSSSGKREQKRINGAIMDVSPVIRTPLMIITPTCNIPIEHCIR